MAILWSKDLYFNTPLNIVKILFLKYEALLPFAHYLRKMKKNVAGQNTNLMLPCLKNYRPLLFVKQHCKSMSDISKCKNKKSWVPIWGCIESKI